MKRPHVAFGVPLSCVLSMFVLIYAMPAYHFGGASAQEASPAAQGTTKKQQDDAAREAAFWQSADYFNAIPDYNAYLAIFPNGPHAQLAKERVAALGKSVAAPEKSSSAAPASAPDVREASLWETALHANAVDAYQAYLTAYPNGIHAQTAKDRAAALASAPATPPSAQSQVSSTLKTPQAPVAPASSEAEIGTLVTEQALNMTGADRIDVQRRLHALHLYNGHMGGAFDADTRNAIAEWQKHHGFAPTGDLGPQQLAALRLDGEPQSQNLAAIPADPASAIAHRPQRIARQVAPRHQLAPTVSVFEVLKEQLSGQKKRVR